MLDLAIIGATVVTPDGPSQLDLGIAGGKTSIISERGGLPEAKRTIDAAGQIVLPGGVDPHIHTIRPAGETGIGREAISRAALYGGMTTIIDFVRPAPDSPVAAVKEAIEEWDGTCFTDYAFHVMFNDRFTDQQIGEIPELINMGFPSFKVFTTNILPSRSGHRTSGGTLYEIMKLAAEHGGIVNVHGEDDDIVMHQYRKHIEAGKTDLVYMPEVHSILSEDLSFHHTLRMASHVPGVPIYFHHVTARVGVEAIREYRAKGMAVYGETLMPLTLATSKNYAEEDGVKYHIYPSLKFEEDVEGLWDGISSGVIHTFGTDGACPTYDEKMESRTIDGSFGGVTGVEPKISLLYTELVLKRGLGLKRLAEVSSENAAKIFGLYPAKGAIMVGSDADYVILDPSDSRVLDSARMHEGDFSPWDGRVVEAWPSHTILNGNVVVEKDTLLDENMSGKLLRRSLDPAVAAGTVLD